MHRYLICVAAALLAASAGPGARVPDIGAGRLRVRLHGRQRPDQEVLEKCACSIDVIASIIPFEEYEAGETSCACARWGGGEKMALFTETAVAKVR